MLVPDVQCTLFDGPLVFRCVFSVKPGLMSRAAGSVWHPARTRFHQQVAPRAWLSSPGHSITRGGGHCWALVPWIGEPCHVLFTP